MTNFYGSYNVPKTVNTLRRRPFYDCKMMSLSSVSINYLVSFKRFPCIPIPTCNANLVVKLIKTPGFHSSILFRSVIEFYSYKLSWASFRFRKVLWLQKSKLNSCLFSTVPIDTISIHSIPCCNAGNNYLQ